MNRRYFDIIDRISLAPVWWQKGGVPRYEIFQVGQSTGLGVAEAALVEVMTQGCESTFLVLIESASRDGLIAESISNGSIDYGDPPNVDCCRFGCASMGTVPIKVMEYWRKGGSSGGAEFVQNGLVTSNLYSKWIRDPSLEIELNDTFFGGDPAVPSGERWRPRHASE
jgi:hypothetical protein